MTQLTCRISPPFIKMLTQGWSCIYKASRLFKRHIRHRGRKQTGGCRGGGKGRRTDCSMGTGCPPGGVLVRMAWCGEGAKCCCTVHLRQLIYIM